MALKKPPEDCALAFGDVVQFGNRHPGDPEHIYWGGIDVVQGGERLNSVEVFPVMNDADGNAFLETPVTRWGTDVRFFGSLTLAQVRGLLKANAAPTIQFAAIREYATRAHVAPPLFYHFEPHDYSGGNLRPIC